MELAGEMAIAAVVLRVFGRDAAVLVRRLAAAGVRAGISEMRRNSRDEGQA